MLLDVLARYQRPDEPLSTPPVDDDTRQTVARNYDELRAELVRAQSSALRMRVQTGTEGERQ